MIGDKYTQEIQDLDAICGRFNSRRENKVLTIMTEVQEIQYKQLNGTLKAIITDEYYQCERKGTEHYPMRCH